MRTGRLKIADGVIPYSAPQGAGREEPFRSAIHDHLQERTQALEDLAIDGDRPLHVLVLKRMARQITFDDGQILGHTIQNSLHFSDLTRRLR